MKHKIQYKKFRAFTLAELLVVVVLVAVLVTIGIISINKARTDGLKVANSLSAQR